MVISRFRQIVSRAVLLGCGVTMCVVCFAIAEATLLQQLPWPDANRLVWFGVDSPENNTKGFGLVEYDQLATAVGQLANPAAYIVASSTLRAPAGNERVTVARVSGAFFDVMGSRPMKGRLLTRHDDQRGAELAVVISEDLWRRLGESNDLVGDALMLEERRFRVVGVLPRAMAYPAGVDAWMTIEPVAGGMLRSTNAPFLHAVGRAHRADDLAQIVTQVRSLPRARRGTDRGLPQFTAEPLRDHLVRNVRGAVLLFAGASGILLAISLLAAVTIQLAARERREREFAIRAAIGATHGQLWRQVLFDALVTAILAGAVGLMLSAALLGVGRTWGAAIVPELLRVHVDGRVYLVAAVTSLFASVFAVALPMISLFRANAAQLLRRNGSGASSSQGAVAFRDALTGLSVGVTLLLVIAFAAAAQSLLRLVRTPTGFATNDVVVGTARLPMSIVTPAEAVRIRTFIRTFAQTVRATANLDVAMSTDVPGRLNQSISVVRSTDGAEAVQAGITQITPNYFSVVGIELRDGRLFESTDKADAPLVAIIDADLARQLYPGGSPLGRTLAIAAIGSEVRIVGVVAPVRQTGRFTVPMPQLYLPIEQLPLATFAVFTHGSSVDRVRELWKSAARAVDQGAAIGSVVSLDEAVYGEMRRPTFYTVILLSLATAAMLVSGAAVYASVAALVNQRTREIGIRMALGASPTHVARMVLERVGRMTLAGSAAGGVGMFLLWRVLEIYAGPLARPTTLTVVASVMVLWAAAGLAAFRPIRHATQINPIFALKD